MQGIPPDLARIGRFIGEIVTMIVHLQIVVPCVASVVVDVFSVR